MVRVLPPILAAFLLAALLAGCSMQRVESQRTDIAVGRPPISSGRDAQDASVATIAQLGSESSLPTSIGTDPTAFDYESQVGALPTTGGGSEHWLSDHAEALRLSRQENKPLLIWFSDSMYAPNDGQLEEMVFSHERFIRAVTGKVIRVRIDYGKELSLMRSDYHIKLRSHFGVRGSPFVAISLPDGTKTNEFKGFKPEWAEGYLDNFEIRIKEATDSIAARQKDLEEQGYRWWTNANGRAIFALPLQYDPESSRLALRGMWGDQWIVQRRELGEADLVFLAKWTTEPVPGRVRGRQVAPES